MKFFLHIFFLTFFLFFFISIYSQNQSNSGNLMFEFVNSKKSQNTSFREFQIFKDEISSASTNYADAVNDGVVVEFDADGVEELLNSEVIGIQLEIPINIDGQTVLLDLVEEEVFSDDFQVRTSDGRNITNTVDMGTHFRGIIVGDANSLVSLSVFRNEIIGFIANESGNYVVGKLADSTTQHIIYNDNDLLQEFYIDCETPDDDGSYTPKQLTPVEKSSQAPGNCVDVYVESGQSVYNAFDDDLTNTTNFLNGSFAQSYVLYANEGITLQTSDMFIWTTSDPYSGNNTFTQLQAFQNNTSSINADIGHLVELQNIGGRAAGFNGICNSDVNESLCFSGYNNTNLNNVPIYSFNVYLITHEMGHLLGSRHTHACVWNGNNTAIDGCSGSTEGSCALPGTPSGGGTIMSYCNNDPVSVDLMEGFHPQPSAVINSVVNDQNNCLSTCNECITAVPVNIQSVEITNTSAIITWDPTPQTLYDLRYRESGNATWTNFYDLTFSAFELSDLTTLTDYEVQIRSKCPDDSTSTYSNSVFFTTSGCTANLPENFQPTVFDNITTTLGWDEVQFNLYDLRIREVGTSLWYLIEDIDDSFYELFGLTPLTQYEAQIRSKCSEGISTDFSSSIFFETLRYCGATANNTNFTRITNFKFNTINNSQSNTNEGYQDFTSLSTEVSKGSEYTIEISAPSYIDDRFIVWIDYNQDGDFDDTGEQVYSSSSPISQNIIIPDFALLGETRMRVKAYSTFSDSYEFSNSPCGNSSYGEVEDYTVIISESVYCPASANDANFTKITNFKFNTIDNSSNNNDEGYQDFTNISTEVTKGSEYAIEISAPNYTGDRFIVWIDYNQDGDFEDSGEEVYYSEEQPTFQDIIIPDSALLGETRMRVKVYNTSNDTYEYNNSACGNSSFGEVEDYTVFITKLEYCNSQGNDQNYEYIGRVEFASIDNTSADENGGYSDFTNISTQVIAGEDYPISITPVWTATVFNEGYAVWIDYNQNGSFNDPGELVFSQSPTQTTPISGNINIPDTALEGPTRMRVSLKWDGVPDPCESFTFGEVEDYTVEIYQDLVYCDSQGNNQNTEYIGRVEFASIDNTSADENGGYSDFTNISTQVIAGEDYPISITPVWTNTVYNEGYAVWIDYNQNESFNDPGELVFSQDPTQSTPINGIINIPDTALEGPTRMRVSLKWDGVPDPCESFTYGEVEDYTVEIYEDLVYCDSQGNNQNDEYIGQVEFASIDNSSADENGGYSNFTNISTPVVAGEDYSISITPFWTNTNFNEGYAVWIDYNQNGSFNDLGEFVFRQIPTNSTPVSGVVNIPETALEGPTRMRVSLKRNGIPDSCESFGFGEVKDYTVEIYKGYIYHENTWTPENPSGVSELTDNITVINGSIALTDDTEADNLVVKTGASLNVPLVLKVNSKITNNGKLTFLSSASSTGQLDEFTGTYSGDGVVEVQRFIPANDNINGTNLGRAFRFLTSTVTTTSSIKDNWQEGVNNVGLNFPTDNLNPNPGYGIHISGSITGANGFDATGSGNPSMFTFNNASTGTNAQDWVAIPGTDGSNTLKAGRAYTVLIRGDRSINVTSNSATPTNTTLRARGDLQIGQVDYGTDIDNLATVAGHYSLVANPYQAVVDYLEVNRTNLTDFLYVWDASVNERGAYVSVDFSDVQNISNNVGSSDANNFIAPGQAFFVQNNSSGNGSLSFNEDDKATSQTQITVFNSNTDFSIQSSLYKTANLQNGYGVSDGLLLKFNDNYTTIANYEDAEKFINPDENYAVVNNGLRSIDKQAMPTIGHEIELSITAYKGSNYSLSFDIQNKPVGLGVFLNDDYLNTQTELTNDAVYNFTVDENIPESIAENRFNLVFDNTTLSINENNFGVGFSLYPNPSRDGRFSIKTRGLNAKDVDVKMHNILGQLVYDKTLAIRNNGEVMVNAKGLSAGVYMVELRHNDKTFAAKLIIQ